MGKISKVFYKEIEPEVCTMEEAGEYYYHLNLLKTHKMFQDSYERYEQKQIELRNRTIALALKNGELQKYPMMNTTVFGVSTLKKAPVVITEI
ncbi:MAG: hypothetical protein NC548_12835 [Lachnospiraceae bacterium]|nr:hypothetical protein [Lachnospiraceae bacterium]MCM1230724.1 hypothetical protein [Ruminococcus flavefaciens]